MEHMENIFLENLFFGAEIFNGERLALLTIRLVIDVILVAFLVFKVYRSRVEDSQGYVFTFFIFNIVIFFTCYLLSAIKLDIGFGFGLFALFSILRYRTVTINIREMSFLFVVISLAIINALPYTILSWVELIFIDLAVVAGVMILHHIVYKDNLDSMLVRYEKIDLIRPEKKAELLEDLRKRTGLDIRTLRVESISFMTDTAEIRIFIPRKSIPTYTQEP